MLLSSWSLKLSSKPLNNFVNLINHNKQSAVIYQSAGKQIYVQKNNQSTVLQQKQISALEVINSPTQSIIVMLGNNNLSAFNIIQNNYNFNAYFQLAELLHIGYKFILVAGGTDLYCLDFNGKQIYNNHLPSNIITMSTLDDFVFLSLQDKSIKIYNQLSLLYDYSNLPNIPVCLSPIMKNTVAVGFREGMVAVYQTKKSKWKAKSKHLPIKILICQIQSMKQRSMIVGRQDGQIQIRNWIDGTTYSKLNLQQELCQIYIYDFRQQGKNQLIFIGKQGTLKAFNLADKAQKQTNLIGQQKQEQYNEIQQLTNRKKILQIDVADLKKNLSSNQVQQNNKQIIRQDFQINWGILNKNKLMLNVTCKNGYIRGIYFEQQINPFFIKPAEKLIYQFDKNCAIIGPVTAKAIVSSTLSNQFQTRIQSINLPKFWKWSYHSGNAQLKEPQSLISFKIRQRLPRYVKWLNQSFFLCLSEQQLQKWQEKPTLKVVFLNSYQNLYLRINIDSNTSNVEMKCDCLTTLGQLIQDLAEYMNIKDLQSQGKFPVQMGKLKQKLMKVEQINKNKTSISSEIAEAINTVKYMIVKSESSRITNNMKQMRKVYTEIMEQNHKLFIEMQKKNQNSILLNELLKDIGQMISKTSNLRLGTARTKTTNLCRNALKSKQFLQLINIMQKGSQ